MKIKTTSMVWKRALGVCGVTGLMLVLQACSDGNTVAPVVNVAGTDVPEAATTSATAALVFIKDVVAQGEADQTEPLELGEVALATSETDEPDETI
jgi:hypothetical protein